MLSFDQTSFRHSASPASAASPAFPPYRPDVCFRCFSHGVDCGYSGGFGGGSFGCGGGGGGVIDPLELSPFSACHADTPVLLAYNPFYAAAAAAASFSATTSTGMSPNNNNLFNRQSSPASSSSPRTTPPLSAQMRLFEAIDACGGDDDGVGGVDAELAALKRLVDDEDIQCLRWRDWSGRSPLGYAALLGKERVVDFFLSLFRIHGGANAVVDELNLRLRKGKTALALACEGGALGVVQTMVEEGADLFAADAANWTPLDVAAFHCHLDIVNYLLSSGSEVHDTTDPNSRTILHLLAEIKNLTLHERVSEIADAILSHCNGSIVNFKDGQQRTALHEANESNNRSLVSTLLRFGAGVNSRDCRRNTPIFDAIGQGHVPCVEEMLKVKELNLGARNFFSYTPLHIAIVTSSLPCVRLLVDAGADVRLAAKRRRSCVHLAARDAHTDILDFLLSSGGAVDVNSRQDDDGRATPLLSTLRNFDAIMTDDPRIGFERLGASVATLLRHGADATCRDAFGAAAATLAAQKRLWSLVRLLVMAGSEVDKSLLKRQLQPMFVVTKRKGSGGKSGNANQRHSPPVDAAATETTAAAAAVAAGSTTKATTPPPKLPPNSPPQTRYIARVENPSSASKISAPISAPTFHDNNNNHDDGDNDDDYDGSSSGGPISSSTSNDSTTSSSSSSPNFPTTLSISIPSTTTHFEHQQGDSARDKQWCVDFLFLQPLQLTEFCRISIRRALGERVGVLATATPTTTVATPTTLTTHLVSDEDAKADIDDDDGANEDDTADARMNLPTPILRFLRLEENTESFVDKLFGSEAKLKTNSTTTTT